MNLYLISQDSNDDYDTYDSAVVCAPDEATAKNMNPANGKPMTTDDWRVYWAIVPDDVKVRYLGKAAKGIKKGVVCASFNAG